MKKCEMTMGGNDFWNVYYLCNKPAKYITPEDPMINGKRMYVCGIHKNSVDALHKRIGSKERCEKITPPNKEEG